MLKSLYEKVELLKSELYQPITLLSHAQEMVEAFIAMVIRMEYKFSDGQSAFHMGIVTETVILRDLANSKGMEIIAVLELNSAFDTVHRTRILSIVLQHTYRALLSAARFSPQPVDIRTQRTTSQKLGIITGNGWHG